jgi:CBS domain-containing protein
MKTPRPQDDDVREGLTRWPEPDHRLPPPGAEQVAKRREGAVSDPDFRRPGEPGAGATPVTPGPGSRVVQVHEVMTRDVAVTHPDDTLEEAAEQMRRFNVAPLPVCDAGRLVGMITDRDIVVRSVARGEDTARDRVGDVMTPGGVICCFADQDVADAARLMREKQVHQLPVLSRDGRLVGIVSLGDLAASGATGD